MAEKKNLLLAEMALNIWISLLELAASAKDSCKRILMTSIMIFGSQATLTKIAS